MTTYYNPFSLESKTILVTGASSGIGNASAIECSKLGANVIAVARNKERLEETYKNLYGNNNKIFICDLLNEDDVNQIISQISAIDGLINCAGIVETLPLKFATRKKTERIFNTNFFATVEFIRLLLKAKKIKNNSSIVTIASIGGVSGYDIGNGIYDASKAALASWMKCLALELAPQKIRVNSICPGMVFTPLIDPSTITAEQLEKDERSYPLGRYGKPEEIAYACIYFLSDASKWVTGTNFIIDGGKTI